MFDEKPWNEAVLNLLLKKYLAKIEFKSENKEKMLKVYFVYLQSIQMAGNPPSG